MIAALSSKGQLTLPIELRRALHLQAGDRLDVVLSEKNRIEIILLTRSVKDLKGMLPKPRRPLSLEEMDLAIQDVSE